MQTIKQEACGAKRLGDTVQTWDACVAKDWYRTDGYWKKEERKGNELQGERESLVKKYYCHLNNLAWHFYTVQTIHL